MSEPRLEDIGDYDTLKGEKKKVVWTVIMGALLVGVLYVVAYSYYDKSDDSLKVEETIKTIPVK
ncbi:MAG: hypothetical protein RBR54_00135 [Sulfurimonas sp.]|jgi:hypothetical protein|nr:hypothetical protein [Sulfurimonas sp.]